MEQDMNKQELSGEAERQEVVNEEKHLKNWDEAFSELQQFIRKSRKEEKEKSIAQSN